MCVTATQHSVSFCSVVCGNDDSKKKQENNGRGEIIERRGERGEGGRTENAKRKKKKKTIRAQVTAFTAYLTASLYL